jgi:hypothetical protein
MVILLVILRPITCPPWGKYLKNISKIWRRRPDLNRGWRSCRPLTRGSTISRFPPTSTAAITYQPTRDYDVCPKLRGMSLSQGQFQGQSYRPAIGSCWDARASGHSDARLPSDGLAWFRSARPRLVINPRHLPPAFGCHRASVRLSARNNQTLASRQSRITLSADTCRDSAVSSTLSPPKKRISTT